MDKLLLPRPLATFWFRHCAWSWCGDWVRQASYKPCRNHGRCIHILKLSQWNPFLLSFAFWSWAVFSWWFWSFFIFRFQGADLQRRKINFDVFVGSSWRTEVILISNFRFSNFLSWSEGEPLLRARIGETSRGSCISSGVGDRPFTNCRIELLPYIYKTSLYYKLSIQDTPLIVPSRIHFS